MDTNSDCDSDWNPKTLAQRVKKRSRNAARKRNMHAQHTKSKNNSGHNEQSLQILCDMSNKENVNRTESHHLYIESDSDDEWSLQSMNKRIKKRTRHAARSRKMQTDLETTKFSACILCFFFCFCVGHNCCCKI